MANAGWLSVEIYGDHSKEHRPKEPESEDDMSVRLGLVWLGLSVTTFLPTLSVLSPNFSLISPDTETQSRPTTTPSPYPKVIELRERKLINFEGALNSLKFSTK